MSEFLSVLKNEERATLTLRSLYDSYGYFPFKMSKFEEYDLYVGNKDFLVSDRVITFNDTDGRLLALKPDVTLSIVKNTEDSKGCVQKVYYNENVYRVSGATGQFKEIMQTGIECIGDISENDVFEVVYLAAKSLSLVSEEFVLDISHMGILSSLVEAASESELFKKEIFSLLAEKNAHEAVMVCRKYGVSEESTEIIKSLASTYGDMTSVLAKLKPLCKTEKAVCAYNELSSLADFLSATEYAGRVRFDFSVVNNMNYYNGIVFRGFVSGICEGVLSGGEYGKLLMGMGRDSGAIGFALYLDLLSELDASRSEYDVDVLLLYSDSVCAKELAAKKSEIINSGRSVSAQRNVPDKLRYREKIVMEGESK